MKILFIDDDDSWTSIFKPILEEFGEVTHFKSSNGARAHLVWNEELKYDLIVCDHNILRFERESSKQAKGTEIYDHVRRKMKSEVPFVHFSSEPCPELYEKMRFGKEDKNFYTLTKECNHLIKNLIEDLNSEKEVLQ